MFFGNSRIRLTQSRIIWKESIQEKGIKKKNFMAPFYEWGSTASRLKPLWGGRLLFTFSSQKFLVRILSTSEGWMAESTLEPPCGFEHGTPG